MDDTVSHAFTVCVVFPGNTAASSTEGYWQFGWVVLLNVLGCPLTYSCAWFNQSLRPQKPECSLGPTAQDVHLDSHTAPEL